MRNAGDCGGRKRAGNDGVGFLNRIAREESVAGAELVIDADIALVPVLLLRHVADIVADERAALRQGISVDQLRGDRIEAAGRNHVAWKLRARVRGARRRRGRWIIDLYRQRAEIALPHGCRRNCSGEELLGIAPKPLIIHKKERSVPALVDLRDLDRAAERAAELVIAE